MSIMLVSTICYYLSGTDAMLILLETCRTLSPLKYSAVKGFTSLFTPFCTSELLFMYLVKTIL